MITCGKTFSYLLGCMIFAGCGGGGKTNHPIEFGGNWDVHVELSANGCPSSVPILESLNYVHTIYTTPDPFASDSVLVVDDKGETFSSSDNPRKDDSFIVTGSTHALNPFVDKFSCVETIVWSYFDIKDQNGSVFTDNVGRNSLIDCRSGAEEVHCNVYYRGSAVQQSQ